ncbi:MAG: AraC family transcriptional regulator [Oxalobacteraceae bacterium]|nr:MAG: AraC family transcriptional regulator [Oxalobacteraceae bacterium]
MRDSLSEVLNLLDMRSARCTRFEAAGRWALRFPAKAAIKFAAVLRGSCWIVHGERAPIALHSGDTFLLTHSPAYVLASDPDAPVEDGAEVIDWTRSDTGRYGGDDVILIAGSFRINPLHQHLLTQALPKLMVIPRDAPSAPILSRTLQILEIEFADAGIGAALMRHHLADMLLVQLLRAFSKREGRCPEDERRTDWIGALAHPRLGAALDAMHGEPARRWTVAALAGIAGMSRTAFAAAFRRAVGSTPMDYLLYWRMQVAEDLLERGHSAAQVAHALGYASQSAFGVAFRRVKGRSPKGAIP